MKFSENKRLCVWIGGLRSLVALRIATEERHTPIFIFRWDKVLFMFTKIWWGSGYLPPFCSKAILNRWHSYTVSWQKEEKHGWLPHFLYYIWKWCTSSQCIRGFFWLKHMALIGKENWGNKFLFAQGIIKFSLPESSFSLPVIKLWLYLITERRT